MTPGLLAGRYMPIITACVHEDTFDEHKAIVENYMLTPPQSDMLEIDEPLVPDHLPGLTLRRILMDIVSDGVGSPYLIANIANYENGTVRFSYHRKSAHRMVEVSSYLIAIIEKNIDIVCPNRCYHAELRVNLLKCFTPIYVTSNSRVIWTDEGRISTVDNEFILAVKREKLEANSTDNLSVTSGFQYEILKRPTENAPGDGSVVSQLTKSTSSRTRAANNNLLAKLQASEARNKEIETKVLQDKAEAEALAAAAIAQKEQETATVQEQINRARAEADAKTTAMFRHITALQAQMDSLLNNSHQQPRQQAKTINVSQHLNIHATSKEFSVVQNLNQTTLNQWTFQTPRIFTPLLQL
jgi:hypothetical protein